MDSAVLSLLSAFLLSLIGLFAFMWSMRKGLLVENPGAASAIFVPSEVGQADDPSLTAHDRQRMQQALDLSRRAPGEAAWQNPPDDAHSLAQRQAADDSSRVATLFFLISACAWLLLGSIAGLTASLKLHLPDWLVHEAWQTFGRMRTLHLTAVFYGWISNACLAVIIWLTPRLMRTPLRHSKLMVLGGVLLNLSVAAGLLAIGSGWTDGMEYLEIPWQIGIVLATGLLLIVYAVFATVRKRQVEGLYVTSWYHLAALLWIALLFVIGKLPGVHYGVQQATMNWWYGHNVLGLWFTPVSVGTIYYFLPKVIGRPVRSYNLSILGFWTLAFFYAQVGGHHLVGGPVPGWMVTLSIVQSMMMIVPVLAFSINMACTSRGHLHLVRYSPTLRFMVFGALMYMLSSLQGSFEALRSVNQVAHFTHFTVAHAHLGAYAFVTMVMFGAFYFMLPRLLQREWPFPRLIAWQFWLAATGVMVYFISLTIGGWLQGLYMLDADKPFMDSVTVTLPYLQWRSVGGALMVTSHLLFVGHLLAMLLRWGPQRQEAALWHQPAATATSTAATAATPQPLAARAQEMRHGK
ncbi:MAG: cbb3-type cytochrome c oxidase subunit I [Comamonas sp.]|nr:cbb3-type cytochrome c oxidase subunit I [Comamonas sp.]